MTIIAFDNSYRRLPEHFYAPLLPAPVSAPKLIAFNHVLAAELGLDAPEIEAKAADYFSGNVGLPGAEPVALAYAGHQFGQFVPQLGDGRAILLGEVIDHAGQRRDIQLKGSGPTPFSRRGDGRAALGPVLREYVVSEAMHALGVPTTRALAAVATGERVLRETGALPGAVLTRVAASHIRVGTFQYFAARRDVEALRLLADHAIARHYPHLAGTERPYLGLLNAVADAQASLIARWMQLGFIHGVMNTDNSSISGETIDYGPCAFLDGYDPGKKFSAIDQGARYAFGNQPGIAQWNLARLAETLLGLIDENIETAVAAANESLTAFPALFQEHWMTGMRRKIGLVTLAEGDEALVSDLLNLMAARQADFTLTFRALSRTDNDAEIAALLGDGVSGWLAAWRARLAGDGQTREAQAALMRSVNPARIPRNHRVEAMIVAAEQGDFEPFEILMQALARPYEDDPAFAPFSDPPAVDEIVERTFCGT